VRWSHLKPFADADRSKYQTDLTELTGTIGAIVDSASFNGQNLLKGNGDVDVLASLNRDASGTVTKGNINVSRIRLTTEAGSAGTNAVADGDAVGVTDTQLTATDRGGAPAVLTITDGEAESRTDYTFNIDTAGANIAVSYAADTTDNQDEIAAGIASAINDALKADAEANGTTLDDTLKATASGGVVSITNTATDTNPGDANVLISAVDVNDGGVEAGGLSGLDTLDISTADGASAALGQIDGLLQTAIDATAEFGSKGKRIDNQNEFMTTLSDSLKTGIGALTDANLEEASARLQSLQVQQQLGVQALSIANQAPQSLLSLFR